MTEFLLSPTRCFKRHAVCFHPTRNLRRRYHLQVRDANNQLEAERAARAKDLAERESPAAAGFAGARPSTRLPSPPELDVASPWVQPSRFVQPRESCDALRPGDGVAKTRAHHKALLHCEVVRGDAAPRAATPASATLPDGAPAYVGACDEL